MTKVTAEYSETLPSPAAGFSAVWLLWLAGMFLLLEGGLPQGLRHLFPAAAGTPILFFFAASAFFLILFAPLCWQPTASLREFLVETGSFFLILASGLWFASVILSRLHPLSFGAVSRAGLVLGGFFIFSRALFRLTPSGYLSLQILFAVLPPLAMFFVAEMNGTPTAAPTGTAVSVFRGLQSAVVPSANTPAWWISAGIFLAASVVCLAFTVKDKGGRMTATEGSNARG